MRKFGEILREVPYKRIEQEYVKECVREGLTPYIKSFRNIYKELLEEEMHDIEKVLLLYPRAKLKTNPEKLKVDPPISVNYLDIKEIRKLHDRNGIFYYYKTIDKLVEKMENLLKSPEKLTSTDVLRMQIYPGMPEIHGKWDITWEEFPSLQIYGHDAPSNSDIVLVASVLMEIASVARSKLDYEFYYNDFDHSEEEPDKEDDCSIEEELEELEGFLSEYKDDRMDGVSEEEMREMLVYELTDCHNAYQAIGQLMVYDIYGHELAKIRNAMFH